MTGGAKQEMLCGSTALLSRSPQPSSDPSEKELRTSVILRKSTVSSVSSARSGGLRVPHTGIMAEHMNAPWAPRIYTPSGFVREDILAGIRALDLGCGTKKLPGSV